MRDKLPWVAVATCCTLSGCAAVDGIRSKAADLSEMDESSFGDARGLEPFEGKSPSRRDASPSGGGPSTRSPLSSPREAEGPKRPRPDGPNMDVYKSRACSAALESLASDASVAPRTRGLAGAVQRCDAKSDHYDLRHAPCSLFQSAADDRAVDASIQELRTLAPVCNDPGA